MDLTLWQSSAALAVVGRWIFFPKVLTHSMGVHGNIDAKV